MKRTVIIMIFATILASCDKVYINGELDGMWKLQQVEQGETVHHPTDIYYSFQRHMTQISKHYEEEIPLRYIGNMSYIGDSITISGLRKYLEEEITATPETLAEFYLYAEKIAFGIETLNDETMILKSKDARYILKKW